MSSPFITATHDNDRDKQPLLSTNELAAFLAVPVRTIYRWRSHRAGPRGYRLGRHVRYRIDDVERWLEAHRDAS